MDFSLEGQSLIDMAKGYNHSEIGIKVPELIEGLKPQEDLLIMEWAAGEPYKIILNNPEVTAKTIETPTNKLIGFIELWFERAVFGDGRFHGDLHGHNIFFSDEKALITPIDFGNVGQLTKEDQRFLVDTFQALFLRRTGPMIEALSAYESVLSNESITSEQEKLLIEECLRVGLVTGGNLSEILIHFLATADSLGIIIPSHVINFARSKIFLEDLLEKFNLRAEALRPGFISKSTSAENIYLRVVQRNLSWTEKIKLGLTSFGLSLPAEKLSPALNPPAKSTQAHSTKTVYCKSLF